MQEHWGATTLARHLPSRCADVQICMCASAQQMYASAQQMIAIGQQIRAAAVRQPQLHRMYASAAAAEQLLARQLSAQQLTAQ